MKCHWALYMYAWFFYLLQEIICEFPEVCDKSSCLFQGDSQGTAGTQYFSAYHDTKVNTKPEDGGHLLLLWF